MPDEPAPPKFDPSYITAMSHFYRGELGRIMSWRQRLDVTTSWAITVTSSIFTIAFSFRDVPHLIFFFNIAVVWMLLWIEARRYRFYDAFRARVRMLEAHFLVPIVSQNTGMLQGEWQKLVCEDLLLPSFKISRLEALQYAIVEGDELPEQATARIELEREPCFGEVDLYDVRSGVERASQVACRLVNEIREERGLVVARQPRRWIQQAEGGGRDDRLLDRSFGVRSGSFEIRRSVRLVPERTGRQER